MKKHGNMVYLFTAEEEEEKIFGLKKVLETAVEATWFIYFTGVEEKENCGLVLEPSSDATWFIYFTAVGEEEKEKILVLKRFWKPLFQLKKKKDFRGV